MTPMNTVGELMDWLATQPRSREVIIAWDPTNERVSPLANAGVVLYEPESTYSGTIQAELSDIAEDGCAPDDRIVAVALGPVNA